MNAPRARRTGVDELRPDPARVVARLFLPGEERTSPHSRAQEVVARVMALDEAEVGHLVARLSRSSPPGTGTTRTADHVTPRSSPRTWTNSHRLSAARTLLLGATFTAEYAVEGAAVCNPSAVLHPDQSSDSSEGQVRIAVSVRGDR